MATYATKADLIKVAPEMSALSDEDYSFWSLEAKNYLNVVAFGDRLALAHAYLIAHLISISRPSTVTAASNASYSVASQSVGGASVSYAVPPMTTGGIFSDWCQSSAYGRSFLGIVNLCKYRIFV